MRNLLVILAATVLLISCKHSVAASPSSHCYELKDGEKIMVPITDNQTYMGVIVISDRNPDPCKRIYLLLLSDMFNRPYFVHYNDVLPLPKKK